MTNHDDGSSFIQTPAPDLAHRHSHHDVHHRRDAYGDAHMHMHLHHHRQHNQHVRFNAQPAPKTPEPEPAPEPDSDLDQDLRRRQADVAIDPDSLVTRIVQTVSVIQYVDGTGATVDVSTQLSPPLTEVVDRLTGATRTPSPVDQLPSPTPELPSTVSPGSSPASYPLIPSSSLTSTGFPSSSLTSTGTPLSSLTSTGSTPPVPTTFLSVAPSPSANSSAFPSLSGAFNSTSPSAPVPFSNSTTRTFFSNSSSITQTQFSSSSWTTSDASLTSSTSSSFGSQTTSRTAIASTAGGPFSGAGGAPEATAAADAPPNASSTTPATPTSTIVGGVVGSICGVALLVFAIVFVLRWRKQQQAIGHRQLGEGHSGPPGTAGSNQSRGFSGRMSQRGIPFSVPAALAALSGGSAAKQLAGSSAAGGAGAPETSERGFYRVSGRKLPSVLQHGGDGYTNPHDSTMSGESDMMYRDSQAFFGGAPTRLAVGSPMRPESGIAVMNPGPARTPVQGQSPLLDPSPTQNPFAPPPPPPRGDGIGRSRPSMDGSRVSASRFTENMA